jgi:8-oxo-dGTP pyrophosphatase MutT (NUDIX family)
MTLFDGGPEPRDPWRTLASEKKYENAWIEVTEHQVLNPSGGAGIYGTVRFKHLAIGVLPIDDEGNTWLVGQYRYPLKRYSWEIPEGGGEPGVDPLESAQRELREETGIVAARWQPLLELDLSNSVTDEHAYIFLATELSFGPAEPEDTEALAVMQVSFDEAYDLVMDGRITDVMSVAAILRYRLMQMENPFRLFDGSTDIL